MTTFVDGDIDGVMVTRLSAHADDRGWLIELYRRDELPGDFEPVMAYVSETAPGIMRGPHEHRGQADYFALIGPGEFRFILWDDRPRSVTRGRRCVIRGGASQPLAILIPPGVVHAYQNVGEVPGWVFNAPNRLYAGEGRRGPVDEIRHENDPDNPFLVD